MIDPETKRASDRCMLRYRLRNSVIPIYFVALGACALEQWLAAIILITVSVVIGEIAERIR